MSKARVIPIKDWKKEIIARFRCDVPKCDYEGEVVFLASKDIEKVRCPRCYNQSLVPVKV